jgi:hypothetical protein
VLGAADGLHRGLGSAACTREACRARDGRRATTSERMLGRRVQL